MTGEKRLLKMILNNYLPDFLNDILIVAYALILVYTNPCS